VQTDPEIPPSKRDEPPVIGALPPLLPSPAPPPLPLPLPTDHKSVSVRKILAIFLSLYLGLFLADAMFSVADDSLTALFSVHGLSLFRGLVFFLAVLVAIVTYGLMGLTPMVPKRIFLPLTLFYPLAELLTVPVAIYHFGRIQQFNLALSLCQMVLAVGVLLWVLGGFKLRWPVVAESQIKGRGFSWGNIVGFVVANIFVLTPVVVGYLAVCSALAVSHFTDGFVFLRPNGVNVQMRKYVRDDGKTVELFPMIHIGDAKFYKNVSQSFPTNSAVLAEGVTDKKHLLTNGLSYHRVAASLGLGEQQKEFKPKREKVVRADVDVQDFTTNTINLLNLTMLLYSKGLKPVTLFALAEYPQPAGFQEQLINDLVTKRNQHLLKEIRTHLTQSDDIVVPWGAGHMPGLAKELEKTGFHLEGTKDYLAIGFHFLGQTN
jgi:hypothetical protein